MAQGAAKHSSAENEKVCIDPRAQAALDVLVERERRRKSRQKLIRYFVAILIILVVPPWSLGFYCRNIIGTNFEKVIVLKYPLFTEKIVRAAVITDKWYLDVLGSVLKLNSNKAGIDFRRTVIALGLEATKAGERDLEKIGNLREKVADAFISSPELGKKGIAFAVYEHPPRKIR